MKSGPTTLATLALLAACGAALAAEGKLELLLGEPKIEMQQVFKDQRLPNVVVATDGTVLAAWGWGQVRVRRSEDGGTTWGPEIAVGKGLLSGGVTVDEKSGDILLFTEAKHPPAPLTMYRSQDHGKNWKVDKLDIQPDVNGNVPSMCMAEHGIALLRGQHKGRLIRPARVYKKPAYNTAIYSDDSGKSWHCSGPFPLSGTGEGAIAELSDGRLYYSSRKHLFENEDDFLYQRLFAWGYDGGKTWRDEGYHKNLPDGPRYRGKERRGLNYNGHFGMMCGLARLPVENRDILAYSNADSPEGRDCMTVWTSFDGGTSWPLKRLVFEGQGAYSSLSAGRPGTPSGGWVYLLFESGGAKIARFNLSWLLAGEKTGDGEVPKWVSP